MSGTVFCTVAQPRSSQGQGRVQVRARGGVGDSAEPRLAGAFFLKMCWRDGA